MIDIRKVEDKAGAAVKPLQKCPSQAFPWGNEDTQNILDILAEHNVHVTFFMTGGWVESYPDDVKAIYEAGHDLGNHSENHKNMSQLSAEEITEEIMSVHEKVKELTGYEMFLFRPPLRGLR